MTEKVLNKQKEIDSVSLASVHMRIIDDLSARLRLLDLRLLRKLLVRKKSTENESQSSKGLFIMEEEVVSLLNSSYTIPLSCENDPDIEAVDRLIEQVRADNARGHSKSDNKEIHNPLTALAGIFGLVEFEIDVLIMAIASEIDKKYEKIYAYFNDDMTKKLPSISVALDVLCGDRTSQLQAWSFFAPYAPLVDLDLICFADENKAGVMLNRQFALDERIRRFITGDNGLDSKISGIARLYCPCDPQGYVIASVKEKISNVLSNKSGHPARKPVFWLYGRAGEEKKATVLSICRDNNLTLLTADLEDIFFETDQRGVLRNIFREAALQSSPVFLTKGGLLGGKEERARSLRRNLSRTIDEIGWITFISAESRAPDETEGNYQVYPVEFKLPEYAERRKIWSDTLNGSGIPENDIDIISGRFNFNESQIKKAVFYAKRFLNGKKLTVDGIYSACSMQSGGKLGSLSSKVDPHFTWEQIVLSDDNMRHMKEICSYIKYKYLVYHKWGFEKKLALGKGLNILLAGPSGTGKTMAAGIVAADLKLDMYKIDLSSVVSKYVGETEKNLNRVFAETASGNTILFFDEADALFGKRSEVKDAHDRYANIEINYLLQKMEEHEGIIILATNLSKNIDDAFLRRLHFSVEFPAPDEDLRELIWRKIFPEDAPLSKDIDYRFLAERLKLTGGNIKNIALIAAFYAADGASLIKMHHIIKSAKREYQKMGKTFVDTDFEPYNGFVEGAKR